MSILLFQVIEFPFKFVDHILVAVFIEKLWLIRVLSCLFHLVLELLQVASASFCIFIEGLVKWLISLLHGHAGGMMHIADFHGLQSDLFPLLLLFMSEFLLLLLVQIVQSLMSGFILSIYQFLLNNPLGCLINIWVHSSHYILCALLLHITDLFVDFFLESLLVF